MYLFLFHRLENLDYALLVVQYVHTLKDFTVFASANLSDDFIIVLIPKNEWPVSTTFCATLCHPASALTPILWTGFHSPSSP